MQPTLRSLLCLLSCLSLACTDPAPKPTRDSAQPASDKSGAPIASAPIASAAPVEQAPSEAKPAADTFTGLKRPEPGEGIDADECAFTGGMGAACSNAYAASKDPIVQRYMRRLVEAHASLSRPFMESHPMEFGGPPHAEVAMNCKDSGPCGQDEGYPCLTRAWSEFDSGEKKKSAASHARACKCDSTGARIPVMAGMGVLACDGDKPVKLGNLSKIEAEEVIACGTCDAANGPVACEQEIARLKTAETELADFLRKRHVPRCRATK